MSKFVNVYLDGLIVVAIVIILSFLCFSNFQIQDSYQDILNDYFSNSKDKYTKIYNQEVTCEVCQKRDD